MNTVSFLGLVNNAALLLALAILYEILPRGKRQRSLTSQIVSGLILGVTGIVIMLTPVPLVESVFFDTRSILISLSGFFFGLLPTVIAVLMTGALRVYQGGAGMWMGALVVLTSAALGLVWRYYFRVKQRNPSWIEFYGFGILVHLVMLLDTFALPISLRAEVRNAIWLPVMAIYPIGTVLLGLLLIRQQELAQEKDLFMRVTETSPVGIILIGLSGQIEYANTHAAQILGLPQDEITGRTFNDPRWQIKSSDGTPYPEESLHFRQVMASGTSVSSVIHSIQVPGRPLAILSINSAPFFDHQGQTAGMVASIEDITERKRAEEDLHRLNEELDRLVAERTAQLQAANAELESFAYSISHDLRAPLRAITGFSEIIERRHVQEMSAEGQEYLGYIITASRRMRQLIDDLLQYSRLGRMAVQFEAVDCQTVLDEVLEQLSDVIAESHAKIDQPESIPPVYGDPLLLSQIMLNLLDNAIKYQPKGQQPQITIACEEQDRTVILKVQDNGIGIAPEYHDKIFNIFQRLHSDDDFPGTGIGLALVKKAVEAMHGKIEIMSFPGQGSAFLIHLPKFNLEEKEKDD